MIRLILEILMLMVIIAIIADDQLRKHAIELGGEIFELLGQGATVVFERGNDLLKNSK